MLDELQRRYPERFGDAVLRTLQRRVGQWRAEHGNEREIYFAQEHPPGRLGLSDFTVADELGISLGGLAFPHRLYQFALAHSGWRHAHAHQRDLLVQRGEVPLRHALELGHRVALRDEQRLQCVRIRG